MSKALKKSLAITKEWTKKNMRLNEMYPPWEDLSAGIPFSENSAKGGKD
jgi:hypothetical protein